ERVGGQLPEVGVPMVTNANRHASTVRSERALVIVLRDAFGSARGRGLISHRGRMAPSSAGRTLDGMPTASSGGEPGYESLWPSWTPFVEAALATFLTVLVAFEARPGLGTAARVVLSAIPALAWWWCTVP